MSESKNKSKIIGIIGTRKKNSLAHYRKVKEAFLKVYKKGDTICSGLCHAGGDRFAVMLQRYYKTPYIWHEAEWDRLGSDAGKIRNTYIAEDSDVLIAMVADDRKGGTEDTIEKFVKLKGDKNLILVY